MKVITVRKHEFLTTATHYGTPWLRRRSRHD